MKSTRKGHKQMRNKYDLPCDGCQHSLPDNILDTYNETTCAKCDMPYLIERDDDNCPHDKDYRKLINLQKLFNISDNEIRQVVDDFDRLNKLKAFL
jgi:hypothetical protein